MPSQSKSKIISNLCFYIQSNFPKGEGRIKKFQTYKAHNFYFLVCALEKQRYHFLKAGEKTEEYLPQRREVPDLQQEDCPETNSLV